MSAPIFAQCSHLWIYHWWHHCIFLRKHSNSEELISNVSFSEGTSSETPSPLTDTASPTNMKTLLPLFFSLSPSLFPFFALTPSPCRTSGESLPAVCKYSKKQPANGRPSGLQSHQSQNSNFSFNSSMLLGGNTALIEGKREATRTRTWTLSELFVCTCHCFQTDKVKQDKINLDKLYIILKV